MGGWQTVMGVIQCKGHDVIREWAIAAKSGDVQDVSGSVDVNESSSRPRTAQRREVTLALGVVFGGALTLAVVGALLPVIAGWIQALLAALLIGAPILVLKGSDKTIDDFGVDFGEVRQTLRLTLGVMMVITPPFLVGFHLLQTTAFEQRADWSFSGLDRWDEALRDTPSAPCERSAASGEVFVWLQGSVIWIVSPPDQRLGATITSPPKAARVVHCRDSGPVAKGLLAVEANVEIVNAAGRGLYIDLAKADSVDLNLTLDGLPIPVDKLRTGAFATEAERAGQVTGSTSPWWLLTFLVVHLGLVALPEEWFFRGYLQGRLDGQFGTPWRLGSVAFGPGLLLSSLAFTLLHPILIPGLHRLLVFFPSLLFGLLRAKTGNIGASVWVHALCNLLQAVTVGMYHAT